MKILICMKKFKGGPKIFRERLVNILSSKYNLNIVHDMSMSFDMELSFIRHQNRHRKPNIIRVDGCYINGNYDRKNAVYKDSISKSIYAIYQSEYSRKMVEKILKVKVPGVVISNGIDLEEIKKIKFDKNIIEGSFVACSLWRKNKRPSSTIRSFLEASTGRHLYIIGGYEECPEVYRKHHKNKYIHFLGKLNFKQTISIFKACQYQIHIPYIDSCPNAVVEGLACGLNVICSNLGGTKELVKNDGIVIETDKWDMNPKNSKISDSSVDIKKVAEGINRLIKIKKQRSSRPDLDINIAAQKYIEVFKKFV